MWGLGFRVTFGFGVCHGQLEVKGLKRCIPDVVDLFCYPLMQARYSLRFRRTLFAATPNPWVQEQAVQPKPFEGGV